MFNSKRIKTQLVEWVKDYFTKNGKSDTKAVIGISGGKDSSVVASLCVEALGKDRVLGVLMPQGQQDDIDVSYDLCQTLNIPFVEVNIAEPVQNLYTLIESALPILQHTTMCKIGGLSPLNTIVTFNTPARVRMATLYAIAGQIGGRVANTSNLSEDWVGYATKFGDTAGDFGPLSDLTVTEVKLIGKELGLPYRFINKVPIDGLCGKIDEDNLGFSYAVLDKYIREGICEDLVVKEKIDRLFELSRHKITAMPIFKLK